MAASAKSSKWWACASGPWPFEPKISRLQHSVDCWGLTIVPSFKYFRSMVLFYRANTVYTDAHTQTPTSYPHTYTLTPSWQSDRNVSVGAYYDVSADKKPRRNNISTTTVWTDQQSSSFFEVLDDGCYVFNNSILGNPFNSHALLDIGGVHS